MAEAEQQPPSEVPSAIAPPAPHLTLQPPLSRLGKGPGLIIVADHYAPLEKSDKSLDPDPLTKWAEEGFAVVQVLVPGKDEEFPLKKAIEMLKGEETCTFGTGVGLISYLTRTPFYIEEEACRHPDIKAIITHNGQKFSALSSALSPLPPQLLHIPGPPFNRRKSSLVPDPETLSSFSSDSSSPTPQVRTFRYLEARRESTWILPSSEDYHARSAALAHTRSLTFLKPLLGGPFFDLEAIWDEHCLYEFGERDVDKTMATMVAEPYVNHIPTMTGGIGKDRLTAFYTHHFIHANPADTELELVSRTVGIDRVVDEFVFKLTHDRVLPWLLPGVPPTAKLLRLPFTSVVCMRGDRLCHEHISWDQATALRQAGLLPDWVPFPGQVEGREPAAGKRFEVRLPVVGAETANKLVEEASEPSNALIERQGWREVDI